MPVTPGLGLPYPEPTDPPDVPSDLELLAEAVEATVLPAPAIAGDPGDALVLDAGGDPAWSTPAGGTVRHRVPVSSLAAFGTDAATATQLTPSLWLRLPVWEFADAASRSVWGRVTAPAELEAGGTPNPVLHFLVCANVAGNARFEVGHAVVDEGETVSIAAWTFASIVTEPLSAGYVRADVEIAVTEPLVARSLVLFKFDREGLDALDTVAGSVYLVDAFLEVGP